MPRLMELEKAIENVVLEFNHKFPCCCVRNARRFVFAFERKPPDHPDQLANDPRRIMVVRGMRVMHRASNINRRGRIKRLHMEFGVTGYKKTFDMPIIVLTATRRGETLTVTLINFWADQSKIFPLKLKSDTHVNNMVTAAQIAQLLHSELEVHVGSAESISPYTP